MVTCNLCGTNYFGETCPCGFSEEEKKQANKINYCAWASCEKIAYLVYDKGKYYCEDHYNKMVTPRYEEDPNAMSKGLIFFGSHSIAWKKASREEQTKAIEFYKTGWKPKL